MSGGRRIEIQVVDRDALTFEVDVLVLKHAQVSLGVDAVAKERLGLDLDMELPPGEQKIFGGRPELGAADVVFLGVPSIQDFGYLEIAQFARRALALVAVEFPAARQIGMTLHGAGYGLDEIACFEAELSGLLAAITDGAIPLALEKVMILESNAGRARRLRGRLADVLPSGSAAVRGRLDEDIGVHLRESSTGTPEERDHAFVAMPFSEKFEDVFHYGIAASVRECGLLCERIDQVVFTGEVLARMKERIRAATLVVADLTDANPNVYLEVGFAWAAGVPTVLIHHADSELKFDVQSEKCLSYRSIKELEERLTKELKQLVKGQ